MIPIHKPATPPEKLSQEGKQKRKAHCIAYSRNPQAYQSGQKRFSFADAIYGHETVKQALATAQHHKCCYCERRTEGDVEHFRPKQAYQQHPGEPLQRPGYYWLAYDWDNLYLACPYCNQRAKKNLFPLLNPDDRAIDHHHAIDAEMPLLIDPGKENPCDWIGFRGEYAFAIAANPRGKTTIDILQLNRDVLVEARREHLQKLKLHHQVKGLLQQAIAAPQSEELRAMVTQIHTELDRFSQQQTEFVAAASWAIQTNFRYVL